MLKGKGFTLVELMVSISILSILVTLSVTNLNSFTIKTRVDNEISELQRLLLTTRNYAINSGEKVTICPLNTNNICTTNWHDELSVFIDSNNNQRFEPTAQELQIKVKAAVTHGDQLVYGKNRTRITYKPTGQLSGLTNGTFRYCPLGYQEYSRGIIIARSGRLYVSTDIDGDGKDENRSAKKMRCD